MLSKRLILLVPLLALFAFVATTEERTEAATWGCTGNEITPGEDIDAIINNDPSGTATRFCVHAGTYQVSAQATLKAGDKLDAEPGTLAAVGPATQPTPVVKLIGSGTVPEVLARVLVALSLLGLRVRTYWCSTR